MHACLQIGVIPLVGRPVSSAPSCAPAETSLLGHLEPQAALLRPAKTALLQRLSNTCSFMS